MVDTREPIWDVAKGIGIVCVFIGHNWTVPELNPISNWIYSFHMPLFFVIAGAFIKDEPLGKWLHRIWKGRVLPYLIFGFAGWAIGYLFANPRHEFNEFACSLLKGGPAGNAPLWFLVAMAGGGALVRLWGTNVWSCFGFGVIAIALSLASNRLMALPLKLGVWPLVAFYMTLGKLLFDKISKAKDRPLQLHVIVCCLTAVVTIVVSLYSECTVMAHGSHIGRWFFLTSIAGIVMVYTLSTVITRLTVKLTKVLAFIGTNSLYFFACDFIFRSIEGKLVHKLFPSMSTWPCYSGWSASTILLFSIAHICIVAAFVPFVSAGYKMIVRKVS